MFDYYVALLCFNNDYGFPCDHIKRYLKVKYNYVAKYENEMTDKQLAIYFGLENDYNLKQHQNQI